MYTARIAQGITFIEGARRGRFPYGNILVLQGSSARVVVDTGAGEEVLRAVRTAGKVDVVINTHYHVDHVAGNAVFEGAEFWSPALETEAMTSFDGFLRLTGWDLVGAEAARTVFDGLGWRPTAVTRGLSDGQVLDFGGLKATVLHLPGHTPGHIGLWFEEARAVFAADIDLSGFGPWYGDPGSNIDDFLDSIRRLAYIVDGWVITSHRRPLTPETFAERLPGYKACFVEREERILALLASEGPLTQEALAERWTIYGPRGSRLANAYKSEFFMVGHHLSGLARARKIETVPETGEKTLWRVR